MPPSRGEGPRETVLLGIAVVVTVVWTVASLVQIFDPAHPVPTYVNLIMATVAGSFFGTAWLVKMKRNGNGDDRNG